MASKHKLVGKVLDIAHKMLEDVATIFEENGVEYMLDAGTLLGIVRENRLLPWDSDLDINVSPKHIKKIIDLKWKFFLKGYRYRPKYYKVDAGPFKKGELRLIKISTRKFFFFAGHKICDIFVKRPIESDSDNYYWSVHLTPAILKSIPKKYFEGAKKITFRGREYSIPKDEIGYLEAHYGKNWRTPVKEWDFKYDDNCTNGELNDII